MDPFNGGGEVRALARSIDWHGTPLGPVASWSSTLRGAVRACLDSPFPINLWCGPELVLIYNDAYRAVLGAKHPSALGSRGPEVWSEIWDDVAPMFERIRAGGPPAYDEDAPFLVRRAGDEGTAPADEPNAWFTFSLSPVRDEGGELVAYLNIVSESTARVRAERAREEARRKAERAEARLRDVFRQAPAFLAVLRGPDHVFEYVNEAYYQLVGDRELVGRPAFEALPDVRGQGFEELLDQVLHTGKPFIGREVPVSVARTPGSPAEERYLDLVYYPIIEEGGAPSGVVAHGSDVTDHVRARHEAQQARVEAERSNRAKSQFLTIMSHEIRTPINAVVGYADLLDAGISGPLSEAQQRYVDGIKASSGHLLGLVTDILDLAKIEAGEMVIEVEEFQARPAALAALHLVRPQAEMKGLTLEDVWECPDGTRVLGDEDRTRQILLNLLSNSLKFTEDGGTVRIRCRTVEAAPAEATLPELGPWLVLDVEDSGRGIETEQLARIFEPFVQGESGHTRSKGGTGLGLTISRRLARLMGGEITVRSEPGRGSTFSLWVRPAVQERVPIQPVSTKEERWPPGPTDLPGLASAGQVLVATVARIEEEWMERLTNDPHVAATERLNRAQVVDQTAEMVVAMGKVLIALEEGGGDPALVSDAEAVQSLIAKHHGKQRRRLGFSRSEMEREYVLLGEILDTTLRREAPRRTAANLESARAVVHRLIRRSAAASLSVFDEGGDHPGPR